MNVNHYRESAQQHGLPAALYEFAYRAAHRAVGLTVWNAVVVTMETLDKTFLSDKSRRLGRFLGAEELKSFAAKPEYDLPAEFIDRAFARGDRCFAFADEGVLMSYGWYSNQPTEAGQGLLLRFDPAYAYMYKGFTLPRFRGQRLHAVGMASALEIYASEGSNGLVSYVDSANFASLKSCDRMGYKTFGRVALVKTRSGYLTRATRGCKAYGFCLERAPN